MLLGMRVAGESDNYGFEQEHLNNVFGAHLRITALRSPSGIGVEFLEYLAPRDGRPAPANASPTDIAHHETVVMVDDLEALNAALQAANISPGSVKQITDSRLLLNASQAELVRDPDGHIAVVTALVSRRGRWIAPNKKMTAEDKRLEESRDRNAHWKRWGPYVSERAWGTVREDYSQHGNAWEYLPHDHARSKAYRWNEDGIAGICDRHQHICFALALWNEKDPILKERIFGLTGNEGNHGEDVKEYYFYLDSTPTHSYMKYLYKYPQAEFPYAQLVDENRRRGKDDPEFELMDTGVFDEDRYFDVVVEYAKASPEDILIRISATNRGPEPARLHLLPTIWFRNTWSWTKEAIKPRLAKGPNGRPGTVINIDHPDVRQALPLSGEQAVGIVHRE